jgi:3-isopropylmalate/(R)-2-methylmalate dehydratase large subunit
METSKPKTIAEKVLARASGNKEVSAGDYVVANIDRVMIHGLYGMVQPEEFIMDKVWDPDRVVALLDWLPAPNVETAESHQKFRKLVKKYGLKHWYDAGRSGISHQIFPEKGYARPGELVVATDSHTTTYGAFNVASTGISWKEMIYVLATGRLWFMVPESIKFVIEGTLPDMIVGKDVVLKIAGTFGTDVATYKSAEFVGSCIDSMSIDSRWTMANMGVEIGAKFALFPADKKIINYVKSRTDAPFTPVISDPGAEYKETYNLEVSALEPQVACPHDVGNVKPVNEVEGLEINQAYLGACTNGRYEDLEMAARLLKSNKVHPDTRMIVIPGSWEVYKKALDTGVLSTFIEANALIANPNCGACSGGHEGIIAAGERCIATINRNFRSRMGHPDSEVYLASPATVAASAMTGYITDPRKVN